MNKTRIVALAVAATLGLGSVSAFAQGRHDGNRAWQHQRWDNNHRFNNHRRDSGDIAGALVLGGLVGALVGSASNNYNYSYAAPPATYYAPPATYYAPPVQYYAPPATYYNPGYGYYGY